MFLLSLERGHWHAKDRPLPYAPCACPCQLLSVCSGSGKICAAYQIFASRHDCTHCTRWAMHNSLAYAFRSCALTVLVMCAQLSFVDSSMELPKLTPNILTCLWNSMPKIVAGALHLPFARALDFFRLRRAPYALSYSRMASWIMGKSVGDVTNIVMSSAYATTVVRRARRPI